jgi:hypothetical protein
LNVEFWSELLYELITVCCLEFNSYGTASQLSSLLIMPVISLIPTKLYKVMAKFTGEVGERL